MRCSRTSTTPSSAPAASAAATASSSPAHGCPAIATSSTSRSPSSRGPPPASSRAVGTSWRIRHRHGPPGRCHYFINLTLEPMAMIWVYAGDMPDRIVMDEHFCHPRRPGRVVHGRVRAVACRSCTGMRSRHDPAPRIASRDWTGTCSVAEIGYKECWTSGPPHAVSAGARATALPAEGGRLPPDYR